MHVLWNACMPVHTKGSRGGVDCLSLGICRKALAVLVSYQGSRTVHIRAGCLTAVICEELLRRNECV